MSKTGILEGRYVSYAFHTRFTRELQKKQLSEEKGLQGIFGVRTIEWEQRKRLLSSDNLIYMVLRERSDEDITRLLRCGFCVAHFYRLHREIAARCFSLQNQIFLCTGSSQISVLQTKNRYLFLKVLGCFSSTFAQFCKVVYLLLSSQKQWL